MSKSDYKLNLHAYFILDEGIYYYKRMLFIRLKNAKASYHMLMNKIFSYPIGETMEIYIDDMLIKSLKTKDTSST